MASETTKEVERELKLYKARVIAVEFKREREATGLPPLFPVLRDSGRYNEWRVSQINAAFEAMEESERRIIEEKYLGSTIPKDYAIYSKLGLGKDRFYALKKRAINRLSSTLGLENASTA